MLLLPNVTADFSERYAVPAMPVVCLAAAFAFVSLKRGAAAPVPAAGGGAAIPAGGVSADQAADGGIADTGSGITANQVAAQPVAVSSRTHPEPGRSAGEPAD
jgi:hypothetical protein